MYKKTQPRPTSINVNASYEGERIEQKIMRIVNNKEPIKDGAPLVYTERKDGVLAEYNPRTDKWEIAVDAMTAVQKTKAAQRKERIEKKTLGEQAKDGMKKENDGKPESTQGTDTGSGSTK